MSRLHRQGTVRVLREYCYVQQVLLQASTSSPEDMPVTAALHLMLPTLTSYRCALQVLLQANASLAEDREATAATLLAAVEACTAASSARAHQRRGPPALLQDAGAQGSASLDAGQLRDARLCTLVLVASLEAAMDRQLANPRHAPAAGAGRGGAVQPAVRPQPMGAAGGGAGQGGPGEVGMASEILAAAAGSQGNLSVVSSSTRELLKGTIARAWQAALPEGLRRHPIPPTLGDAHPQLWSCLRWYSPEQCGAWAPPDAAAELLGSGAATRALDFR